jgi:hypothetical protein
LKLSIMSFSTTRIISKCHLQIKRLEYSLKFAKKPLAAGASSQTPLGELTALSRIPYLDYGRGRRYPAQGEEGPIFLLSVPFYSPAPPLTIVTSDAYEILLIVLYLVPLLLLSFNLNLTIAILFY